MPYGREKRGVSQVSNICIDAKTGANLLPSQWPRFYRKLEEVMSFRTRPRGSFVFDHVADPYGWFLKSTMASRRASALSRPGVAQYLLQRADPKPASAGKKNSRVMADISADFADTGHPFVKIDKFTQTSHNSTNNMLPRSSNGHTGLKGGPVVAYGAQLSAAAALQKPPPFRARSGSFQYAAGTLDISENWDNQNYYAQLAIARTAPNDPVFNASTALGELISEGLPSLGSTIGASLLGFPTSKNVARDYVATQFGVAPFIRDIAKMSDTLSRATAILRQYERDSYKGVRRSFSIPTRQVIEFYGPESMSTHGYISMSANTFPSKIGANVSTTAGRLDDGGSVASSLEFRLDEKIWFSGSYSYYLPIDDAISDRLVIFGEKNAQLQHLLGMQPTIETLWELAPWSWLVDWFFDVQSSISAHTRLQDTNLVINYGYLMRTLEHRLRQESVINPKTWAGPYKPSMSRVSTVYGAVLKQRVRANPFGFGIKQPEALSLYQLSILAGIGISRSSG